MTTHRRSSQQPDPLDALTEQLLECGGVLGQIISHMVEFEASGQSSPDAAPIHDVARLLIRDVIGGLASRHSATEISAAAAVVDEATEAISKDIFFVSPDMN
jgi:hypothetical protein